MARPLRVHVPGMIYHVMSRGNAQQIIFTDDRDCERYLELLERTCARFCVRCLAYCLLDNHVHLLLQPGELPISRMMQQLNSVYCQGFNRRHSRVGHVLQGRYKATLVESPDYFLTVIRYIVRNPVKCKLVASAADWLWSSYRATVGLQACPRFLSVEEVWGAFNALDERTGQRRFADYVNCPDDETLPTPALILGSDDFVRRFRPLLAQYARVNEFVRAERFAARPSLPEIFGEATDRKTMAIAAVRAFQEHAYTLREIGARVRRAPATVWSWIHRISRKAVEPGLTMQPIINA